MARSAHMKLRTPGAPLMPDTSFSGAGSGSTIALGELGPDAAHHAGATVFLDPIRRRRRRVLEEVGLA
jgi:hypothetical protein